RSVWVWTARSYGTVTTIHVRWQSVGIGNKCTILYLQRKNSVPETSRYSVRWITEPEALKAKSHRWCDTCRSITVTQASERTTLCYRFSILRRRKSKGNCTDSLKTVLFILR